MPQLAMSGGLFTIGFTSRPSIDAVFFFQAEDGIRADLVTGVQTCALPISVLLVCAVYGVLIERYAVRPFVQRGSDNWLMATVAVGIIVDNVMLFVFGKEPRSFPSVLAAKPIQIVEGAGVYPLQLLIPVVGLLLALALHLISRRTRHGVAMLAVVQNPNAARLMGINVSGAIAASYAVSAMLAGVAALLIAPLLNVSSEM